MSSNFQVTEDHIRWAKNAKRKYKQSLSFWIDLIQKQNGKCALTGASLLFDAKSGTPRKGGLGCHPLYASVDHVNPSKADHGFEIVCYDINDLKGHLPPVLFNALRKTEEWKRFVKRWEEKAELLAEDRQVFRDLITLGM